jgi:hypothetical protein
MFYFVRLIQSIAPYCGLLAGACALAAASPTALFGGESFPSRASIESVLVGHERGQWLTLERGTLLMTELVVDTQVANRSGKALPTAYLVPYVSEAVAGPDAAGFDAAGPNASGSDANGSGPKSLAVIRFTPRDFEARFPEAYALANQDGTFDAGLLDVVFDRRSCEVLRASASDLSPNVRHFLMDRWGLSDSSLLLFDAGARPMSRIVAVAFASIGLGVLLAACIALIQRRARNETAAHGAW